MSGPINFHFLPDPVGQPLNNGQGQLGLWTRGKDGKCSLVKQFDPADNDVYTNLKDRVTAYVHDKGGLGYVTRVYIDYANKCIDYDIELNGVTARRFIPIEEASKDPDVKVQMDLMKGIADRHWGSSVPEGTVSADDQAYGLGSASNPILGEMAQKDVLLNKVVRPQYSAIPAGQQDAHLERLATAKHLKKKFHAKVKAKIGAVKAEVADIKGEIEDLRRALKNLKNQRSQEINQDQRAWLALQITNRKATIEAAKRDLAPINDQLTRLENISNELEENWEETTLPVLLAYRDSQQDLNDDGLEGYKRVADDIERQANRAYGEHHKEQTPKWWQKWKSHPAEKKPGLALGTAFVKAGSDPDYRIARDHGHAYSIGKTGIAKESEFMDKFNHFILHTNLRCDTEPRSRASVQAFNAFLQAPQYEHSDFSHCLLDDDMIFSAANHAEIGVEKGKLQAKYVVPAAAVPVDQPVLPHAMHV